MIMNKKTAIDGVQVPVGVCWNESRKKWRARITHNGRKVNLGEFDSLEQAVEARQNAEEEHGVKPNLYARDEPPLQKLIDMLLYDPVTGAITWIAENNQWIEIVKPGVIRLFRTHFWEDRLVWKITRGKWPVHEVRHINGDLLDNQILNLVDSATPVIRSRDKTNLFVGVRSRNNRFQATIRADGKLNVIGSYETAQEAVYARLLAVQRRNVSEATEESTKAKPVSAVVVADQIKRKSRW